MVEAAEALGGAIVNIASVVVNTGAPNGVHYAASKAGLVGLTRVAEYTILNAGTVSYLFRIQVRSSPINPPISAKKNKL